MYISVVICNKRREYQVSTSGSCHRTKLISLPPPPTPTARNKNKSIEKEKKSKYNNFFSNGKDLRESV